MVTSETLSLILWHAGFESHIKSDSLPLIECGGSGINNIEEFKLSLNKFLMCMQKINREINGITPSNSIKKDQDIPRKVVYAISELMRVLREISEKSSISKIGDTAQYAFRAIEIAWLAVLAGDIDDLLQHIDLEEQAL